MAVSANIMTVRDFIAWACSNGCTLHQGARIAWRLDGNSGALRPRYLIHAKKRLAVPQNDNQPLSFYAVWIYRDRLGIEAEPT